jgi:hypothetical protein
VKIAEFTTHATAEQSARWKQVSAAEGFPSVGAWLARAGDAYIKARFKSALPVPLGWARASYFEAVLHDDQKHRVRGWLSRPFGIFRGDSRGRAPKCELFSLTYIPTGRLLATCRTMRDAKVLASELARIWVRWDGSGGDEPPAAKDSAPVVERFQV